MTKYFFALYSLSVLFLLQSCGNAEKISPKEEQIFAQSYHRLVIPLDSIKTLNDLVVYLEETYCEQQNEDWPIAYFDMKSQQLVSETNRNTITIGIDPSPCYKGEYDDRMILEVIKDGYNTEVEQFFTEIDSIPSFVKKQMLSRGEDPNYAVGIRGNGIWLCTKKDDQFKNLNPYLYQLILGYVEAAREFSRIVYSKNIDELSEEEYQELLQEFVFHLSFKYTDKEASIEVNF